MIKIRKIFDRWIKPLAVLATCCFLLGCLSGCRDNGKDASGKEESDINKMDFGTIGETTLNTSVFEEARFKININWKEMQAQAPVYRYDDNTTVHCYAGLNDMAKAFGGNLFVEGDTAIIACGDSKVYVKAGAEKAVVDGECVVLPYPVKMAGDVLTVRDDSACILFGARADYTPVLESFNFSNVTLDGKVGEYKGRNVFLVNDQPYAPQMYCGTEQGRSTWKDPTRSAIQEFINQGYEIIQTDTWFKYLMKPDGTFDMASLRTQMASILEMNPDVKLIVRINVSAPQWWLDAHPDEKNIVTNPETAGTTGASKGESFASESYRAFAKENLIKFLEEMKTFPESNHIIGFHIGGGVYGEWHYYGFVDEPDISPSMNKWFANYALDKYGSLDAVNKVWKTDFDSESKIIVPSYERRYQTGDQDYRDPEQDQYVIDYYRCQQDCTSSLVEELGKITKETWERPVITGVFFGYLYGSNTVGAVASQLNLEALLKSPYIDYFAGPFTDKNMYGSSNARTLADSIALNGKIWFTEHDNGTYLGSSGDGKGTFPDVPKDEEQSIDRMRRTYMYTLTENSGQWWYDFGPRSQGGGWWNTPGMMEEAGDLLRVSNELLETEYSKPADTLLVYDMESYYYMRPKTEDKITTRFLDMTYPLLASGAAIDRVFLFDLDKVDLSKYKTVIFGNINYMDETDRVFIKEHVITEGRSVVFMSGAGYSDGVKNDTALISDLVGMNIKVYKESSALTFKLNGQEFYLGNGGIQSLFCVDDPSAEVIGRYPSGTVGAVKKKVNGCQVYYFGMPLDNSRDIIQALLTETGTRFFTENLVKNDYVSVGGGIIGVYSSAGGEKVIKPLDGSTHKVNFDPFTALYFDINTGDILNTNP